MGPVTPDCDPPNTPVNGQPSPSPPPPSPPYRPESRADRGPMDIPCSSYASELHDFRPLWPRDVPPAIDRPWISSATAPLEASCEADRPTTTFMEKLIYAHTLLLAASGVVRRAVEYTLNTLVILVLTTHLAAGGVNPSPLSENPAKTLRTVRSLMGANVPSITHPVCPNMDCQAVLYHINSPVSLSSIHSPKLPRNLPDICPECGHLMDRSQAKTWWRDFARIPLKSELERVLAHPGIEELMFNWQERRQLAARWDASQHPGQKIYRDQWSGSALDQILGPDGNRLISDPPKDGEPPVIYMNLYVDWVNCRSSMSTTGYSVGHISLQAVNLPQGLRGVQNLIMCCGLTPGALIPGSKKSVSLQLLNCPFTTPVQARESPVMSISGNS